jgi:O-antigen/teichoic acid export membrane protein
VNPIKIIGDKHLLELLTGSFISFLFKFFSIFVGYFFFWVLAKLYGAEGVGIFSTLWTLLMLTTVIAKLGLDTSIVKFIAGFFYVQQKSSLVVLMYRKGIYWVFFSGLIVCSVLLSFSERTSYLFFETENFSKMVMLIAGMIIPFAIINYNAASLRALKHVTGFSILQNGTINLIVLTIIGLLYLLGLGKNNIIESIYSLGISLIILLALSFLMIHQVFIRKLNWKTINQDPFPYTNSDILRTSLPMLLSSSLFLFMNWTDILMLSAFKPEEEVGIYNTALKIAALNSIILFAVNSIAMPKYAELYGRKDDTLFKNFIKQTTLLLSLASLPIFLLITLFPDFLLGFFGSEFTQGRNTLIILAFG